MKTNRLLVGVIVVQGLMLVGWWSGRPAYESVALAQVPDAGAQRIAMIEELKALNAKIEHLNAFLEDGQLRVRPVK